MENVGYAYAKEFYTFKNVFGGRGREWFKSLWCGFSCFKCLESQRASIIQSKYFTQQLEYILSYIRNKQMPLADIRIVFGQSATIIRKRLQIIMYFQKGDLIAKGKRARPGISPCYFFTSNKELIKKVSNFLQICQCMLQVVLNRERFNTKLPISALKVVLNRERFNTKMAIRCVLNQERFNTNLAVHA